MKYVIIVDDSTKVGKGLLEIAKNMGKLYKSVVVDKLSHFSYNKSHTPNACTKKAIQDALNGKTEKMGDVDTFFKNI